VSGATAEIAEVPQMANPGSDEQSGGLPHAERSPEADDDQQCRDDRDQDQHQDRPPQRPHRVGGDRRAQQDHARSHGAGGGDLQAGLEHRGQRPHVGQQDPGQEGDRQRRGRPGHQDSGAAWAPHTRRPGSA
jgi:hypothetical protein